MILLKNDILPFSLKKKRQDSLTEAKCNYHDESNVAVSKNFDRKLLSEQQKIQIASSLLVYLSSEGVKRQTASEKLINSFSIIIGETELRMSDIQKCAFDFKKMIAPIINENYETIISQEKVAKHFLRFFQTRGVNLDRTLDTLQLEQSYLINKFKRLHPQIKQKEESSSKFHYIEYHEVRKY